jgi:D-3-phosphoglycerate dehydrogenase / 2-oxoglutarate reductase
MSHRIYIAGSLLAQEAHQILVESGCIIEQGSPKDTPEEISRKLKNFNPDGMIVRQCKITKEAIDASPNLKVIAKHGVGVDNIDVETAFVKNIAVMITANANFESVAEHTLAMIMSLLKRIPLQDRMLRQGVFDKSNYDGEDLYKKTVGIIGFGRIGRRVAELVSCIAKDVIVYDPFIQKTDPPANVKLVSDLDQLFKISDIITLHCSLNGETKGMVNKERIELMRPASYIINLSRGAIINEADLIYALQNNKIAGAALDTFEKEPPDADNPLFKLDNVIMTSHIGGTSKDAFISMGVDAVNNVLDCLNNKATDPDCVLKPK